MILSISSKFLLGMYRCENQPLMLSFHRTLKMYTQRKSKQYKYNVFHRFLNQVYKLVSCHKAHKALKPFHIHLETRPLHVAIILDKRVACYKLHTAHPRSQSPNAYFFVPGGSINLIFNSISPDSTAHNLSHTL